MHASSANTAAAARNDAGGDVLAPAASAGRALVSRRRRLGAAAIDAASVLGSMAGGAALAFAWLLLRTSLGRSDAGSADGVLAASLAGATIPAWSAFIALRVRRDGATPGQRRTGLAVEPLPGARRGARHLRLALHPVMLPLWGWLTLTALLGGLPWLFLLPVLAAAAVVLAGTVSFAMLLASPHARAVHDRLAQTALVPSARQRESPR